MVLYMRDFRELLQEVAAIDAEKGEVIGAFTSSELCALAAGIVDRNKGEIERYIANPESEIYDLLGEWLTYQFMKYPVFDTEVVDVGYDVSTHARSTRDAHSLSTYDSVRDFLDQPNGATVPTFESGFGLMAETYDSDLDFEVRENYRECLIKVVPEIGIGGIDFYGEYLFDALVDNGLDELAVSSKFSDMSIRHIVEKWRFKVNAKLRSEDEEKERQKASRRAYQEWLEKHAEPALKAVNAVCRDFASTQGSNETYGCQKINKPSVFGLIKELKRLPYSKSVVSAAVNVAKPLASNTASMILGQHFPLPKAPDTSNGKIPL